MGVLQPILVRPAVDDHYEIIAGERRWRAAKRAGLLHIPAIIREIEDTAALEHALGAQQRAFARDLERLETAPGVGPIVAATTLAVFSEVTRFPSAKHAASYAGLVPSTYQSGTRDAHGRITKRGSAELRAMLCEAAQHARRPTHPLHPYFTKLCAKRGYKMAVIAVAHRLARILFAMLRDGTDFDVHRLGIAVGPFTRTTVDAYRLKRAPRAHRA